MSSVPTIESNLKNVPPPHPGEDQSAKRAKLDESDHQDTIMDAEPVSSEFILADTIESDSQISEVVPETPLSSASPPAEEAQIGEPHANVNTNVPSFKDMLLNADSKNPVEEEDDIVLNKGDVSIGLNGTIPTVDFASHVIETLNKRMGLAVVVKLLGRKMGYRQLRNQLHNLWKPTGQIKLIDLDEDCFLVRFQDDLDYQNALLSGPWVIFGHYLTVQPWTPSFKPQNHVINHVMGWIRLPKLPARYYHKSVIRSIRGVFGEVIRVDYNTDSGDRGDSSEVPLASVPNVPAPNSQARETFEFGSWMQVQRRRRPSVRGDRPNETSGYKKAAGISRYEVLRDIVEDEVPQALDSVVGEPYPKADGFIRRSKGNATKNSKRSSIVTKPKGTMPQEVNQDGLFQSKPYAAREATSSLDPNYNRAVLIEDPRLPRRSKEGQRSTPGPNGHISVKNKPANGNDPLSKSRGLKLSTSVTIQKLGGKPTSITEGPSSNLLKEVANDLQMDHDVPDVAMQEEGVNPNPNLSS
ncbi:hypothetical protein K1719_044332 [Acacia pycnantha]|nr:hypothetical protein K1719_044332 [Acacia pycnantha]